MLSEEQGTRCVLLMHAVSCVLAVRTQHLNTLVPLPHSHGIIIVYCIPFGGQKQRVIFELLGFFCVYTQPDSGKLVLWLGCDFFSLTTTPADPSGTVRKAW